MAALVMMVGGHKTLIPQLSVSEVEHAVREAREMEHEFLYIQTRGDNQLAIDPQAVVAIVAAKSMADTPVSTERIDDRQS